MGVKLRRSKAGDALSRERAKGGENVKQARGNKANLKENGDAELAAAGESRVGGGSEDGDTAPSALRFIVTGSPTPRHTLYLSSLAVPHGPEREGLNYGELARPRHEAAWGGSALARSLYQCSVICRETRSQRAARSSVRSAWADLAGHSILHTASATPSLISHASRSGSASSEDEERCLQFVLITLGAKRDVSASICGRAASRVVGQIRSDALSSSSAKMQKPSTRSREFRYRRPIARPRN